MGMPSRNCATQATPVMEVLYLSMCGNWSTTPDTIVSNMPNCQPIKANTHCHMTTSTPADSDDIHVSHTISGYTLAFYGKQTVVIDRASCDSAGAAVVNAA